MTKIMDLHCDTISRIRSRRNEGHICGLQDNHFHVDLKRMKEAGYSLQTFALFADAGGGGEPFLRFDGASGYLPRGDEEERGLDSSGHHL